MLKKIHVLSMFVCFSSLCEGVEEANQADYQGRNAGYFIESEGNFDSEIAQRNRTRRRDGRPDFYQNRNSSEDNSLIESQSPGVGGDNYWNNNRRQDYLQGERNVAYPPQGGSFESGADQPVPTSNPRWYKEKSGRREYLKGGNDYMKR